MAAVQTHVATVLHPAENEEDRFLPEGPRSVVIEARAALVWVNIQTSREAANGDIHVRFWDGEHARYAQPRRPGFVFPTNQPDYLFVGLEKEVGVLHLTTNTFTAWAKIDDANPRTIINDGEIVPGGDAIVFGTKDVQFAGPIANLYLFTLGDRRLTILADQQTCSNGKVFRRDESGLTLFDIDTPKRNIVRYRLDLAERRLSEAEVVMDLRQQAGFPDGMTDSGDGSVIVAFYNPDAVSDGRAVRFDLKSGEEIEVWTTPGSPRVTCPLLIDHDRRLKLVLTTATEGMPEELRKNCPNAGDLFWGETLLHTLPPHEIVRVRK
jgi:sugar lactone lactonase YvrE